jgi:hypothetical protein
MYVHVAGDGRDGYHADARIAQSHDDGDGIVGSGIGINEEGARHARKNNKSRDR